MKNIQNPYQTSIYDSEVFKRTQARERSVSPSVHSKDLDISSLISNYSKKGSVALEPTPDPKRVNRISRDLRKSLPSNFVYSTTLLYREIKNKATKGRIGKLTIKNYRSDFIASVYYIVDLSNVGKEKLNAFDFLVHDYIITLYNEDYQYITLSNFVKMVWGKDGNSNYNPTKEFTSRVVDSLIKLHNSRIEISCEEQFEMYNLTQGTPSTFIGSAIDIAFLSIPYGSSKQIVVELRNEPVLLSYSKQIDQCASVDRNLFNLNFSRQTDDRVLIAHYLVQQITYMKSSNQKNYRGRPRKKNIRFDTLIKYSNLSITFDDLVSDSRKRKEYVKSVMKILASFKEKGFILDFEKEGTRTEIAFHINLENHQSN